MFGFGESSPVAEYEASGDIERVYHEIRQTLRISGVNLVFRVWARHNGLLPVLWDAVRPNAETLAFETAADQLRIEAAKIAHSLGPLNATDAASLGPSQAYQLQAALQLYHYINPKLLLLTSAVRLGLSGDLSAGGARSDSRKERIAPGIPARMVALEMEDEKPADERVTAVFDDIIETLSLKSINSDYRTMALWPNYLEAAWQQLKPVVQTSQYHDAADRLRELARKLAADLPLAVPLSREKLEQADADFDTALQTSESFERLLPGLIINIGLCLQDWPSRDQLDRSPFPAAVIPSDQRT